MRVLLALDTSFSTTGVAIAAGGRPVASSSARKERGHSENLVAHLCAALREGGLAKEELTGIVVTRGPGSFTGLRVGIAFAKGLAAGLNLPMAGVSSLAALARPHLGRARTVAVAVDAKKGQVYSCAFREDSSLLMPEAARDPASFAALLAGEGGRVLLVGSGAGAYRRTFEESLGEAVEIAPEAGWEIDPASVALLGDEQFAAGETLSPGELTPVYLRRSEAEEKYSQPG